MDVPQDVVSRTRHPQNGEEESEYKGTNGHTTTFPVLTARHSSGWSVLFQSKSAPWLVSLCVIAPFALLYFGTSGLKQMCICDCGRGLQQQDVAPPSNLFEATQVKSLDDFLRLKQLPDQLLEHKDMEFCPNIPEPTTEELDPIPEQLKLLMIIGSQKSGTTWLFQALYNHPAFIAAVRRPGNEMALKLEGEKKLRNELLAKEPQYFNRWPLLPTRKYLHCWETAALGSMVMGMTPNKVLLDGSPQYLMNAAAPARIRGIAPHARFIVVVRDGPIRTYSDWRMMTRVASCATNPARMCSLPGFLQQVNYELNDPKWRRECFFNGTDPATTWWDCHRCHFGYVDAKAAPKECAELERSGPPDFRSCTGAAHTFLDHGLYAAQLAWWLRFFPPEQFLIVSSWQLRDPVERVKVLNRIIPFAGIPGAEKFTAEMVNDKHGFPGNYNTTQFTANETAALAMLREFFRKPQEDLKELVDAVWPEAEFRIEYET